MNITPATIHEVEALCARFHAYGGAGKVATYCFAVRAPSGEPIAAWSWAPPPFGAAKSVSPECHWGVLALTRMVAIPREERDFHISKPLRIIMRRLIDRSRWPVLLTYSDAAAGHSGHTYKCSGWANDGARQAKYYTQNDRRVSCYSNGRMVAVGEPERTTLTRWVHRVVPRGEELALFKSGGWKVVPTGKVWASGRPAHRVVRDDGQLDFAGLAPATTPARDVPGMKEDA